MILNEKVLLINSICGYSLYGDMDKILSVEQWGTQEWSSMNQAFYDCKNLKINATDLPNLSSVTDMSGMFYEAISFNQDIGNWDVSNVTNMDWMFVHADSFNQDLSSWDVDQVTACELFSGESTFWSLPRPNFTSCDEKP
jgi:surface protein